MNTTSSWFDRAWLMLPLSPGSVPLAWVNGRPYLAHTEELREALQASLGDEVAASAWDLITTTAERFQGVE